MVHLGFSAVSLSEKGLSTPDRAQGSKRVQNESGAPVFLDFQITMFTSVSVGYYFYSELFAVSTEVPILGCCGDGHLIKDHVGLNTFRNLIDNYS